MTWTNLVEPVGWTLVHFIWQGLVVGILHEAALHLAAKRSPQLRYAISLAALSALAVLPIVTFAWLWSPSPAVLLDGTDAVMRTAATGIATGASTPTETWMPWVVALWMAGVAGMALRFGFGLVALNRLAANADHEAVAEWIVRELDRLRERMGMRRPVRVALSLRVTSPLVIGWLKPVILLPLSAVTGLDHREIRMVLAHELAHLSRYDHLVNLAQVIVETLLFYHPAVHRVSRSLRREREQCCDDTAAAIDGNALAYARVLAQLEEIRQREQAHALALGIAEEELYTRIQRLVGVIPASSQRDFWLPAMGFALLALIVLRPLPEASAPLFPALFETGADARTRIVLALPPAESRPYRPITTPAIAQTETTAETGTPTAALSNADPGTSDRPATTTTASAIGKAVTETDETPDNETASTVRSAIPPPVPTNTTDTSTAVASSPARSAPDVSPQASANGETEPAATVVVAGGELLHAEEPAYPRRALRAGREGEVLLAFTITPTGRVENVEVVDASPSGYFERAAKNAIAQWRFRPFTENGKAIAKRVTQVMEFRLTTADVRAEGTNRSTCEEQTGTRLCRSDLVETTLQVLSD